MFMRNGVLATAAVAGVLVVAAPVAGASAAPMSGVHAGVGAAGGYRCPPPGYQGPGGPGGPYRYGDGCGGPHH